MTRHRPSARIMAALEPAPDHAEWDAAIEAAANVANYEAQDAEYDPSYQTAAEVIEDRIRALKKGQTMTDQDLTAPEHVERLCEIEENGGCADLQFTEYGPTLRALSAALEAERERAEAADAERDQAILALASEAQKRGEAEGRLAASEMPGMVDSWKRRAEAAEAKLEEAVKRMEEVAHMGYDMPSTFAGTEGEWYSRRANLMQGIARTFLANLEGDKP